MAHVSKRGSTTRASGATLVASTLFAKKPPSTEVTTGDTMDTDSIDIQPLGLFRTVCQPLQEYSQHLIAHVF